MARPRRLLERFRRRADFDPDDGLSTPVRLADGNEWSLPRPWLELVPVFRGGKAVDRARVLTCGDELDELVRAIAEGEPGVPQVLAVLTLGATLLLRNYDLDDAELARLFTFRPGEPESEAMLRSIIDVATGRVAHLFGRGGLLDPKPPAAG